MAAQPLSQTKVCTKCGRLKAFSDFHVRRASPDGMAYKCRECVNSYTAAWQQRNPDAFKRWYEENRDSRAEYWAKWYDENREHRAASYAAWARNNKHIINSIIAKRSAAKKRAIPSWADHEAMRAVYAQAAWLTETTGVRHEVDHIYPLQGESVCGLHCEANLQILTKTENIRKSNRMPDEVGCGIARVNETQRHRRTIEGDGPRNS